MYLRHKETDLDLHPIGIPFTIVMYDMPGMGGAIHPGRDMSVVGTYDMGRYALELVTFYTPTKIHGLLVWERYRSSVSYTKQPMFIPPQPTGELYFFGYKCSRCKEVYLVPDSVKSADDLPVAMRHECRESKDGR